MQSLSPEFESALQSDALSLCLCWTFTRRDGVSVHMTDHDVPLTVDEIVFDPGAALEAGRFVQSEGLKPTRAAGGGVLSSDAISETDLRAGIWDGCRVDIFQTDWRDPTLGTRHVWSGYLSEIQSGTSGAFEAELISLKSDLERPIGRVLQRRCDAVFGDERCGVQAEGQSCDQRFETCRDVFANTENFRGFPHMPGNDFMLAGPAAAGNDGGKR
ncbi:MAG: DUF2163 domain-containing protein [Pseudomonadota bacterium]